MLRWLRNPVVNAASFGVLRAKAEPCVRRGDLVGTVRDALAASGLAPSRLELEITEGLLLQNTEAVLTTLRELHKLGVRIAMDDFGTGYSSLNGLLRFPFDKVKIDRSFITDIDKDPKAAAIVATVVRLCHILDLVVTAEGVETLAQAKAIEVAGCNEAQGYFFGRPAPMDVAQMTVMKCAGAAEPGCQGTHPSLLPHEGGGSADRSAAALAVTVAGLSPGR